MKRLTIAALLLITMLSTISAIARGTTDDAIAGRWIIGRPMAGAVEPLLAQLDVHPGEGNAVTAELSIAGHSVPFEGTFDPSTGTLALEAHVGDQSATITLTLKDGKLSGEGDLPGEHLTLTGRREDGEPTAPSEVDFTVERPIESATGALPSSIAEPSRIAIEEVMDAQGIVGLSAAFVMNNKVVDVLSFGWEDFEKRAPATDQTMYRWASVAKPLSAVAALQLADDGNLDLDADTRTLVPEYDKGVAISARELMTHRAGVPHYDEMKMRTIKEYPQAHPWTDRIVALDMFIESDLIHAPGSGFRYSTPGYVLLGAVIERASDGTYAEQVARRICKPLGMTSMRPDHVWEEVPHRASAYQQFDGNRALLTDHDDISWKLPAGGWISTAGDMARFATGLMGTDLIDGKAMEMMVTPPDGGSAGYAMGIGVRDFRGQRALSHSGGQVGTSTYLLCCPESGLGVVIMANTEGVRISELALQLLELLTDSQRASE